MSAVLNFEDVRAFYGNALIVDGLSFSIEEGECFAILGANGVGKTTSLNAMFGIAEVRGGAIQIDGQRVDTRKLYAASRLGAALVPQGRWIIPHLTIEENLILGQASKRKGSWTLARVYELFPDLESRSSSPGTALSGGQQQMLAIGRALMANPRILLLDEPSEGLAPVIIDRMAELLLQLRSEGTSMLLIEQRLDLVQELADNYLIMAKGEVTARGAVAEASTEFLRDALVG